MIWSCSAAGSGLDKVPISFKNSIIRHFIKGRLDNVRKSLQIVDVVHNMFTKQHVPSNKFIKEIPD